MRRIYFVVDLSLLRGPQREAHLAHFISAVARTWAVSHLPDVSFGYQLYDSSCGDCAVTHYLQKVASSLKLPQRLQVAAGSDLGPDDLPHLVALIDKATDEETLQRLGIRQRRSSRSVEVPARALVRALQAALGSAYLQKLEAAAGDSASAGNDSPDGVLVLLTPALGDSTAARAFLGAAAADAAGGALPAALADLLPAKLRNAAKGLPLRCAWLSAEDPASPAAAADAPAFSELSEAVRSLLFPAAAAAPLAAAAAPSLTPADFAGMLRLPYEPEILSSGERSTPSVDDVWPTDDPDILDALKVVVASLERPYAGRATGEGKRKLKVAPRARKGDVTAKNGGDAAAAEAAGRTLRGQRLQVKALRQRTASVAAELSGRSGGAPRAGSVPPVDAAPAAGQAAATAEAAEPLSIDAAVEKIAAGLAGVVDRAVADGGAPAVAGPAAAGTVQQLVSAAVAGILASEAGTDDPMDLSDIRIALAARTATAATDFKSRHAAGVPAAEKPAFAWHAAVEVLLRLSIASEGAINAANASISSTPRLDATALEDVVTLLNVVSCSMQPLLTSARTFFLDVVTPRFGAVLPADVAEIERRIWGDGDDDAGYDEDGGLAGVRAAAASIEVCGETPDAPKARAADPAAAPAAVAVPAPAGRERTARPVLAPRAAGPALRARTQPAGASMGSLRSGDGSGVHGAGSSAVAAGGGGGATAASRGFGALAGAEFLSRRYTNSRQYAMQLRVGGAPQAARAKQAAVAAVAAGGVKTHRAAPAAGPKASRPAASGASHGSQRPSRATKLPRAVPDTPQDNTNPPEPAVAPKMKPRQLFSPAATAEPPAAAAPALEEAIPNTTPQAARAVARTGPGIEASPLRQLDFGAAAAIPGAILPATAPAAGDEDEDIDIEGGGVAPRPAAAAAGPANWFASAVVPKGNVARPTAAAVVPAAPVEPAEEEEEEEEGAPAAVAEEEPAAPAEAMEEEKESGAPEEEPAGARRVTRARAAAVVTKEAAPAKPQQQKKQKGKAAAAKPVKEVEKEVEAEEPARRATRGSKKAETAAAAPAPVPAADEPEKPQTRKRTRSAKADTAPTAVEPAPSKRRASTRLQKSAATATAAAQKEAAGEPEVESPAAAAPPAAPVDAPAAEVLDFERIMAADVVVSSEEELAEAAAVLPAAAAAAPPPLPVLAPEAAAAAAAVVSPPAAAAAVVSPPMLTPLGGPAPTPSLGGRTASVLGKRPLMGLGRTPATKRGRLGAMLGTGSKPQPRTAATARPSPPVPPPQIADIGSPNKPSPYGGDWDLPASPPQKKKAGAGAAKKKAPPRPPRGGRVAKRMAAALDAVAKPSLAAAEPAMSAGESTGEASSSPSPAPAAAAVKPAAGPKRLPKLGSLSPASARNADESDEEDNAVLEAACAGRISPTGAADRAAGDAYSDGEAEPAAAARPAAPVSAFLEATPADGAAAVASTPQTHRRGGKATGGTRGKKGGKKAGGAAAGAARQLRMTKMAGREERAAAVTAAAAAAGAEGVQVPSIGDDIRFYFAIAGQALAMHCRVAAVAEVSRDGDGGWACRVEAQPVGSDEGSDGAAMASMNVVLRSAGLRPWQSPLGPGQWAHLQGSCDASPAAGNGPAAAVRAAAPPGETARHNAAIRRHDRDTSVESEPVLASTRLEREAARAAAAAARAACLADADTARRCLPMSPHHLRPVHLDMDRAVAGMVPAAAAARRDSMGSGGSLGMAKTSPMAAAMAAAMIGTMYVGVTSPAPEAVERLVIEAGNDRFMTPARR